MKNGYAYIQNADTNAYLEEKFQTKAPSGYGYGGQAVSLGHFTTEAALTTALASVYDAMGNHETKMVTYSGYPAKSDWRWFGILDRSSANNGSFVAHSVYNGGSKIMKSKYDGSWLPCEWENPPLLVGVEYRTTERYEGKPVYAKFLTKSFAGTTIGHMETYSDYYIDHGATGITNIVRVHANLDGKTILPYNAGGGGSTAVIAETGTQLRFRIVKDTWVAPTLKLTMYYTKG